MLSGTGWAGARGAGEEMIRQKGGAEQVAVRDEQLDGTDGPLVLVLQCRYDRESSAK